MATRDEIAAHLRVFAGMGIDGISRDPAWRKRDAVAPQAAATEAASAAAEMPDALDAVAPDEAVAIDVPEVMTHDAPRVAETLESIRADLGECTRCGLHATRRHIVFGVGNANADLMFVGEAPGADEDAKGEPFVGDAGQLLTKIIEAIGMTRGDVYIANVLKCRPPKNRNPELPEIEACSPFLLRQIDVVRPRVIVALGTFSAQLLLQTNTPISRLRGRLHDYRGTKLMPTFHPAYLLRSPERKRDVWEDMKIVRALLAEPR
jgi:DNA polymerase